MNTIVAMLCYVAASTLIGLAVGFRNGGLDSQVAALSLIGALIPTGLGFLSSRKCRSQIPIPRGWAWIPVVLFLLFALRAFLWLIFREKDELRVLSPNNLGDMSLHLTFINYLKNGAPLWPDSPIFANGKTAYALGMDFFNSLLALAGLDVIHGLVLTGLICALLTGIALWRWGGAFTLMAFLANGTLMGFACLANTPGEPWFRDYTGYQELDSAWKSLPLALLVTQRGFLFALPAGLALLASWRTRFFQNDTGWRMPIGCELLLYAAMPFFHVHTFIALSFLLGCFFIVHADARRKLAAFVAIALVPATTLLYFTTGMFQANALPMWENMDSIESPPPRPSAGILGWQPGWEVNDESTVRLWRSMTGGVSQAAPFESHGRFLLFWIGNFGLWPFLVCAASLVLAQQLFRREIPARTTWGIGLAIALLTPMLGWSHAYQTGTVTELLLGSDSPDVGRQIGLVLVVLGAVAGAIVLHRTRTRIRWVRWVLVGFAALFVADSLFASARMLGVSVPLLRANSIPLILVTIGFLLLMIRIAARWDPAFWQAAFLFPGIYLFFLSCNVKFAPWAWDNTKIMVWAYLVAIPSAYDLVMARWSIWKRAIASTLLFAPGAVILLGGIGPAHHGFSIAQISHLDSVSDAVRGIPITESFAAEPTYNHPLLLNGRKLALGYTAHLESHGIRHEEQLRLLDSLMTGTDDWRIAAATLGTRYLYFGPGERGRWPDSRESWRSSAQVIASGDWGELFDLEMPPLPIDDDQR